MFLERRGHGWRGRHPDSVQLVGELAHGCRGLVDLGGERRQAFVGGLERREVAPRLLEERDDLVVGRPVLAVQTLQRGDPLADLGKSFGVEPDPVAVIAELGGEVADLGGQCGCALRQLGRIRVQGGDRAHVPRRRRQQVGRALVIAEHPARSLSQVA